MAKINVFDAEIAGRLDVGRALGAQAAAMYLYELGPGRSASPYHYEYEEEWVLVVDGTVVLRMADGEQTLERGDLVRFPAGPAGAHKLMNRAASAARLLMFSNGREPAVSVYPDSDKIGVWPGDETDELIFKRSTAVQYSEGEEGWENAGSSHEVRRLEGGHMSNSAVARFDGIEEVNDGRCPWRSVATHFGIRSFGINTWTGRNAGDRIINEHDESEPDADEELYVVLQGRATFELDGEQVDAPLGTLVFAPPGVKRTAIAAEPETTIVAVGGVPGKAYEPSGWPLWAPLHPLYMAGEYTEAADRGRELIEAHPEYGTLFYNVACCESLAGRTDDALEHLRRAIELSEGMRTLAKEDSDLEPIRGEPAFRELVGT
jgi:uncharacterized cupin superfamily protein